MSVSQLSEGSLGIFMNGEDIVNPIIQILKAEKADKDFYRLLISDGKYKITFAIISPQINELIASGQLSKYSIVKVKNYTIRMINNAGREDRRIMMISELEILTPGEIIGKVIGNPIKLPEKPSSVSKNSSKNGASSSQPDTFKPPSPKRSKPVRPVAENISSQKTVPIININPSLGKWVIKAKVLNKSGIHSWSNSRGQGKLFTVDLVDESGEIQATVFTELVDKFYNLIEIDKIYYISQGRVKLAKKKVSHEFEILFSKYTTVTPCSDELTVPKPIYNFLPIDQLSSQKPGSIVDVIGICISVGDIKTIINNKKELKKREVTLVDQSNSSVVMSLWEADAENFTATNRPVLAVRGAKVGEFDGRKKLTVLRNSVLKVDPDLPKAHHLRGWFDNKDKSSEIISTIARPRQVRSNWYSIAEVKQMNLGEGNSLYFLCKAAVLRISPKNVLYEACPTDGCYKKMVDLENLHFWCDKCNKEYDSFKYRIILSAIIGDWSDSIWVSIFTDEAEKIIGMTSQEFGELVEDKKYAVANYLIKPVFNEFIFECKATSEVYKGRARLSIVVKALDEVNYKEYNDHLITTTT